MMKQRSFMRYLFAILIALSFLPLLLSGNDIKGFDDNQLRDSEDYTVIVCDVCEYVETLCAEDVQPFDNNIRITRNETSRRLNQPKCFDYCFKGSSFLIFSASILFVTLILVYKALFSSRSFIIKYIHDQDGDKRDLCMIG